MSATALRASNSAGSSSVAASSAGGAASATRDAVLSLLVRHGHGTAAELARQLSVSVQVMRRHLRSLEDDGLVEASPAAEGPGRPSNHWRLTARGQGRFPDGSEHFALGLMESLAGSLPAETMQGVLEQQAVLKATTYRQHIGNGPLEQRATWRNAKPIPLSTPERGCSANTTVPSCASPSSSPACAIRSCS
jgi:DeoR family suf operon transcriptional repressor